MQDVIDYTQYSRSTLERLIRKGKLRTYQAAPGCARRFRKTDIDEMMDLGSQNNRDSSDIGDGVDALIT